ncbi:hypothetical protein PFLA_a2588 [Pseudoalteromonas flavipulchra NCIMB 2033 = ATCC BAA-314]|nr:hypothetical protein [Pseudoalteromonas flavipulchra NCIMB 2033 = ATCC BAA-314]
MTLKFYLWHWQPNQNSATLNSNKDCYILSDLGHFNNLMTVIFAAK